ncbi:MAG TPA: limonene-1,2-epoxide hydrolase family protein [Bryobacteraceae bacterium]|nr:limonene-1,2-epoxide hydrolase family protein [Bryobacteraceae bacterium]
MSRNLLCCTLISVFTLTPLAVKAAEPTAAERANLDLVTQFCESFATRVMAKITAFLSPDVVYRITDTAPALKGAEALARIRAYVERSTSVEFKILDSWVRGSVVVNERIDAFTRAEGNVAYHLTGVFLVKDGKIVEWADYSIR